MDFAQWVHAVEYSGVGQWMRTSVKGLPIVEATHVACAAIVFGTVFVVDLRLIGVPHNQRPVTLISEEMLRLTWGAFVISVVTGTLMFTANAHTYVVNTAFRIKMLALVAAGLNMLIFQHFTYRSVGAWDKDLPAPRAARWAGIASICIWVAVIFLGRWIGFTKGYVFEAPPPDVNFSF
jgi:uncharacterized membrane-anchored protein